MVRSANPGLAVVSLEGRPLDEQLRTLSTLSPDTVVIFVTYRADHLGRSMTPMNVLQRVLEASRAPVYGAIYPWLGTGIVGGDLIRYDTIGEQAGQLAVRVLRGEPPGSIPPVTASPAQLMFDWRQLQRWGIDEARPPGRKHRDVSHSDALRDLPLAGPRLLRVRPRPDSPDRRTAGGAAHSAAGRGPARAEVRERERGEQDLRQAFDEIRQPPRSARSGQHLPQRRAEAPQRHRGHRRRE